MKEKSSIPFVLFFLGVTVFSLFQLRKKEVKGAERVTLSVEAGQKCEILTAETNDDGMVIFHFTNKTIGIAVTGTDINSIPITMSLCKP